MPQYRVTLSDGRVVTVEADKPPTEEEVLSAIGDTSSTPSPAPSPSAPSAPEENPLIRYLKGVAHTTIPSAEAVRSMIEASVDPTFRKPAEMWANVLKGTAEQVGEDVPKELGSDRPAITKALRTILAGIPSLGHSTLEALNKMEGGDIAGGAGELSGLALPFMRPFKAAGVAARAPLETSAAKNVARAVKATEATLPKTLANADAISQELGVGTTEQLARRAGATRGRSFSALEEAKATAPGKTISLDPTREALQEGLDLVDLPKTELTPAQVVKALQEGKNPSQMNLKPFEGTLDTGKLSATKKVMQTLDKIDEAFPEGVPAEAGLKLRTQAGDIAERAGRFGAAAQRAGGTISPEAAVFGRVQKTLSNSLKEAVPGLEQADFDASLWKQVGDTLENAARKGVLKPAPALEVMAGREGFRTMLALAAGGGGGAMAGGPLGAALGAGGAYGAWRVAQNVFNSSLWNSLSASQKFALSRFLGRGYLAGGAAAGTAISRGLEAEK